MKSLLSLIATTALVASAVPALAQSETTTTTTWSNDEGPAITQYSTTQHYAPVMDPAIQANVGVVLPESVTVYPLPPTIHITNPDQYSYTIVNNRPVVVERTTRRVVHTWD
jgi:hypothetical protein